jgi:hypothetical protein
MSQIGALSTGVFPPAGAVLTLTGNAGGAVGPSGLGNINVVGGTFINIVGNPGANTLTANFVGNSAGMIWTVDPGPGPTTLVAGHGYFANSAGTITYPLPTVAAVGDTFSVVAMNNDNSWKITVALGQIFTFGNTAAVVQVESQSIGNSVTFVCNVANTEFTVIASQGNPDVV